MTREEENKDTFFKDFSNRLRELRNNLNISAREMSLSLGQNVNYINLIENGKRMPSMQGFFSICEYLKTTPADFFTVSPRQLPKNEKQILDIFSKLTPSQCHSVIEMVREFKK